MYVVLDTLFVVVPYRILHIQYSSVCMCHSSVLGILVFSPMILIACDLISCIYAYSRTFFSGLLFVYK